MKKLILLLAFTTMLLGCGDPPPAGTLENIDQKDDSVQVYRYWYGNDGGWVYVSFFKGSPNVQTTTWHQQRGKYSTTEGNVVINSSANTYTLASVHNKGVVLKKKDVLGDGHNLIIQTSNDVVKEKVTEEQYDILAEGDTIK